MCKLNSSNTILEPALGVESVWVSGYVGTKLDRRGICEHLLFYNSSASHENRSSASQTFWIILNYSIVKGFLLYLEK